MERQKSGTDTNAFHMLAKHHNMEKKTKKMQHKAK